MIGTIAWGGGVALAMALATAGIVKLVASARTRAQLWIALFLLAMMAEMWVGAAVYVQSPRTSTLVEALALSGALMAASVAGVFALIARYNPSPGPAEDRPIVETSRAAWIVAAALVLGGEGLMAGVFVTATGGAPPDSLGWAGQVASVLLSPWFVLPMAVEMAAATVLLWERLSRPLRVLLPLQAAAMALTPTVSSLPVGVTATVVGGSVVMVALIVYVMEHIYRHRELPSALGRYLLGLLGAYALMMVGLLLWLVYGSPVALAAGIVAEMVVYFGAVLAPDQLGSGDRFGWQLAPGWTFALLGLVLVGELFMGAALDLTLQPSTYAGTFFALPLDGPPGIVVPNALYDGFWFFANVAGSAWFLAMMGAEMGALVVFKFRETRSLETRIRLGLMLGSYGAFAVFFPSVYYAAVFPNAPAGAAVPVLGWSMGIGSAPLGPSVFLVVFASYLITGSLVVLFGRRVVCSTFCTAALMYQGTTIDAMKSFNRSGPVGRKFLGSRFSTAYQVSTTVTMGSLVVASFASYFDQIGRLHLSIGGSDPTAFLFALYFGVLWYVMFVTIPYTGNYNCVTMGWCYTGTIAAAFQKIGFFKLKVRSREVCQSCTTLDCAKHCPVGLVDMPGHFRTKGEFRSTKCCGVGDCVEACPYDNIYIHDVRHWLRRAVGRQDPSARQTPLPMVRTRTPVRRASAHPLVADPGGALARPDPRGQRISSGVHRASSLAPD
ncbi:MAG TPA: hypothetical protein VJQ43_04295 [Thermoplasmata archaeon]|nr:hypothetical protein [Thermoplasmata archaeon]